MVLESAKASGAFTIGITNEPESSLAKLADETLLVRAGKEKSVAATKTYTGQLACFYLLAYALGASIEEKDLLKIPGVFGRALNLEDEIRVRAERYCFMRHALCVGRGLNYSNSFEFALKLMETCYSNCSTLSRRQTYCTDQSPWWESLSCFHLLPTGSNLEIELRTSGEVGVHQSRIPLITDRSNNAAHGTQDERAKSPDHSGQHCLYGFAAD